MGLIDTTDYVTLLSAVTATGASTPLAVDGTIGGATVMECTFTGTATVTFQASVNGTDWYSVQAERLDNGDFAATTSTDGLYRIEHTGQNAVRANVTARTDGAITVRAASQTG